MLKAQRENRGQREGYSKKYKIHCIKETDIKPLQTETIVLLNEVSLKLWLVIPISHGKTSLELNDTGTRFKCLPTTTTLFSEPFCMALESL